MHLTQKMSTAVRGLQLYHAVLPLREDTARLFVQPPVFQRGHHYWCHTSPPHFAKLLWITEWKNITGERKKNKMNSKYFFFSNCSSGWNNSHNKQQSLYRLIINKQLSWKRKRLSLQLQEFNLLKPTLVSSTSVPRRSPRNSNPNSDWPFSRLDVYILLLT